ncbi:MAG: GGDEF domain-containing protein [Alphaproteobacteria bacterium]|nr:GGDEF domain-containing protein [Alphaproteobacteria bacterium]
MGAKVQWSAFRKPQLPVIPGLGTLPSQVSDLGLPPSEITPRVSMAVSALLDHLKSLSRELDSAHRQIAELTELVDVDCLVPLPNRRAFTRRLDWAIKMFQRYKTPFSILFCDINNLKPVNDQLGHQAGDAVINRVAELLRANVRDSDFVARLGGDEFAAILFHARQADAQKRVQGIQAVLQRSPLLWNGKKLPLSVAIGIAEAEQGDVPDALLDRADRAMYARKHAMRPRQTDVSA